MIYASLPVIAVSAALGKVSRATFRVWIEGALIAATFAIPFLLHLQWVLDPPEREWALQHLRSQSSHMHWVKLLPHALHDITLVGAVACLGVLTHKRRLREVGVCLALCATIVALMAHGAHPFLPFSEALYPDRLPALLPFFLAWLALETLAVVRRGVRCPIVALASLQAAYLLSRHLALGRDDTILTRADAALIRRSTASLPPECAVLTNYGDGGQWIPAIAGRFITAPQVNVVWFAEMPPTIRACAGFRGEKLVYGADTVAMRCPRGGSAACRVADTEGSAEWFDIDVVAPLQTPR